MKKKAEKSQEKEKEKRMKGTKISKESEELNLDFDQHRLAIENEIEQLLDFFAHNFKELDAKIFKPNCAKEIIKDLKKFHKTIKDW